MSAAAFVFGVIALGVGYLVSASTEDEETVFIGGVVMALGICAALYGVMVMLA